MNEEIQLILESAREQMSGTIDHLKRELSNIRAGKASPMMLQGVNVDYYGSQTPLSQIANINTPDAQTLSVQPYERTLIPEIEKAIMLANLGLNPMNNGESVIINVPPLTEERRKELAKAAKSEAESDKVSIRNARKDANNDIKKSDASEDEQKNAETSIQEITNKYIKQVDDIFKVKEAEIMKV